jgi:hypothetical protein
VLCLHRVPKGFGSAETLRMGKEDLDYVRIDPGPGSAGSALLRRVHASKSPRRVVYGPGNTWSNVSYRWGK